MKSSKILINYSPLPTIGNVMTKTNTYEKLESYNLSKIKNDIKKQIFKEGQFNKTSSIENQEAHICYFFDKNNKLKITLIKDLDYINNKNKNNKEIKNKRPKTVKKEFKLSEKPKSNVEKEKKEKEIPKKYLLQEKDLRNNKIFYNGFEEHFKTVSNNFFNDNQEEKKEF